MVTKKASLHLRADTYVQQKWMSCGAYAVKAVMNLYGKDENLSPRQYLSSLGRIFFGFMFPSTIKNAFQKKKFIAPLLRARRKKHKLLLLKQHLEAGHPVIVLINNIYSKMRKPIWLKKFYSLHWITLLGYDDEKKVFYVYDSLPHKSVYEKNLPVGNISISYNDFLTFWKGNYISRLVNYLYIPVEKK